MNEQKASQIALFTEAEYAWNPAVYSPDLAWEAALQEIGGEAYEALKVFADANRSGRFLGNLQAPTLASLTQAVREAYEAGADLSVPAGALKEYVQKMSNAPDELRRKLPGLADETAPWLDKLERSAVAVNDALDLLQAMADRDDPSADAALKRLEQSLEALRANPKETATGVVDPFVAFASEEYHKLKQRYLALALPYGMRAFPVGVATEAEVILYASSPDEVRGTLKVEFPEGWIVKDAVQQIALPGNGRTSAYAYGADVTVPAGALPGYIHFRFEEDEGRVVTASMYVQPANMTNEGYRELVLADAPNAFWRLDDLSNTLVDISGNDLHGIYRSEVERGVPGATNDGNAAVRFAGGYAEVPSTSEVSPVGPFTIEAWIRPEVVAGGDGQGIVEKYSAPARNGYLIRLDGGNRLMAFTMSSTDASYVVGGPSIGLGEWHHVAAVFDGVSLVIYLDGIEVGRNEKAIIPEAGPISLKIGARGDDRVRRFTGGIDDVAFYSKALSAAEIAEHFLVGVR
ncbi:hypothetical protein FE782_00540 [Paenibacillus antri]|uniref:LamG-like jellyroll fold domain-containing protein n=2 Tax=Paenibacillus antri TaxID=2582848 RepID=A0A5R9GHZ8_9BACL|nr:hypothetical protein FE782_00540 [Paenibacillus antri]